MPSPTRNKRDDTRFVEPTENQMFDREGLDRKGIRREFANTMAIALDDIYMERDDVEFVDPRTTEMPYGPSGMGEFGGTGVETLRINGERWETFRYVAGFEMLEEDAVNDASLQRDAIMEQFDFLADANFLTGVVDRDGTQMREGMFDWLRNAIPAERTFDCEDYDNDGTGNESGKPDLTGREEDLFSSVAYDNLDFRMIDSTEPRWDLMVGRKQAIKKFFRRSKETDTRREAQTYLEILRDDEDSMAGINGISVIPDELQFDVLPDNANRDPFTVDLTSELGTDEVFLLPDMEAVAENYWMLSEMPSPDVFGPYEERGGREAFDYAWRYSHKFDPHSRYKTAPDSLLVKNVSELFV